MDDPRILDLKKIKGIPNFIPIFVGVSYFLGFIVVNSFLAKYNFFSINLLNTDYLVAGTLFSLIFGILIFSIFVSNKNPDTLTDDVYDFLIPALFRVFIISACISFFTIPQDIELEHEIRIANLICIFFIPFVALFNTPYIVKRLNRNVRWILIFIYILSTNFYIFLIFQSCRAFMILTIFCGIGVLLLLSEILDKKYYKVQAVSIILSLVVIASLFGSLVYENIPKKYGGGKPYKTTLLINESKSKYLIETLDFDTTLFFNTEILFETKTEFLVKEDSLVLVLDKTFFHGRIKTK